MYIRSKSNKFYKYVSKYYQKNQYRYDVNWHINIIKNVPNIYNES